MKHERQRQKTPLDSWRDRYEYIKRNVPAESWSTYFSLRFNQFLHFLQRQDKLSSIYFMNMSLFQYSSLSFLFFFFVFFSFLKLKLWRLFPFGILWKQTDRIPLYRDEHSLECQSSGELISCGGTVRRLPPQSCRTSTNTDGSGLEPWQKLQPAPRPPAVPPEAAAFRAPSLPDKCSAVSPLTWVHSRELWVIVIFFRLVLQKKKKNTDLERKAGQDLTLHQLNDAEPC